MANKEPRVILRLGSHAEKDYVEKTLRFLHGLIVGANLIESTPGATASMLVRLCGKTTGSPYFLDPMTYAFGCYFDKELGALRDDMDWIKSDQVKKKKSVRTFKRSYVALADRLGGVFSQALSRGKAILPSDLADATVRRKTCESVLEYQSSRIAAEFMSDPEYASFASDVPPPQFLFAPYFYIEPSAPNEWLSVNLALAGASAGLKTPIPVHAVICVDQSFLENQGFIDEIVSALPKTGVSGVWFWISRFREDGANAAKLRGYRRLVEALTDQMAVYAMHGGYLSLVLSKLGLSGTSHAIGYGEQKDVVPVIGQSTPTVRYYLRAIRKRLSVLQIERCFDALGIAAPSDFEAQVCDCVVCKGILAGGLSQFASFGDMRLSTPQSKRMAQTPAAAKRCRFHFILNRVKEMNSLRSSSLQGVIADLRASHAKWSAQPALQAECDHLLKWSEALA
jgi:hypothetical protein